MADNSRQTSKDDKPSSVGSPSRADDPVAMGQPSQNDDRRVMDNPPSSSQMMEYVGSGSSSVTLALGWTPHNITRSESNSSGSSGVSIHSAESSAIRLNPRQPRDLQGLLRLCMRASQGEDTTVTHTGGTLDEERTEWLESVLNSMSTDAVETLMSAVEVIERSVNAEGKAMECQGALETLADNIGSIDMANNFFKMGGFRIFRPCLESPHENVRAEAANVIGELTQNNPSCQIEMIKANFVPLLVKILDTDQCETVQVKALYALSCMVRDSPPGLKVFADSDGFPALLRAMQSNVWKLKVKASFMISIICSRHPAIKDTLHSMGFVEQLVGLIQGEHNDSHEHMLAALCALAEGHLNSLKECRRPELGLQSILENRLKEVSGKDESQEEAQHCRALLDMCFSDDPMADR